MNITISQIENVMTTEYVASGKISFVINGKSVKNAVYIYDIETGCTVIKQNTLVDGHTLGGDPVLVDEYCYACEAAQKAVEVMLSKRQDAITLGNVRINIYDTKDNGDVLGDFTGIYFVGGTSYRIESTLFEASMDGEENIKVDLIQNPHDTHWRFSDHVKSGAFATKEEAHRMIEEALAKTLQGKAFESINFYDEEAA